MSVRKRSWRTGSGDERTAWIVDYVDTRGKRRRKTFKLKKEADAFAATAAVEVREGVHIADSESATVAQAGDFWIASCEANGLERTTIDQYRQHLRLHIRPFIGETKLSKLNVPAVKAFQDQLRENGRSAAMVKRATVSLGSILSDAQERGLATRNPVREMSQRRQGASGRTERRSRARLRYGVDIPTQEEVRALLTACEGRYRPLLITAVFTGMRSSELRGLPWSDVDLDRGRVEVSQRADRFNKIGMPKTDAGQRTIPLTPLVVNTLREWKLACPVGDLDLVFPNSAGNVEYHANIVNRGLKPTLISAGVTVEENLPDGQVIKAAKYTGLHALRHWYASWCINSKANGGLELSPKAVQERMGHGSIQVTYDTYSHLFPPMDEQQALADAESKLLGG